MKKRILFAAVAAVMMFASCSKTENDGPNDERGEAAYISITMKSAGERAINPSATDDDQIINDMIVFVVRSDNKTFDISPKYFPAAQLTGNTTYAGTPNPPKITATTKADKVYIITNTGAYTTGAFKNCANMDDVRAVAMAVDGNPNTGSQCGYKNVWMAGESTGLVTGTVDADGTPVKNATIQLNYIAAKVFVVVENRMDLYENPATTGNTRIDGVAMINAGAYTGFVKNAAGNYEVARTTALPQAPFYYNGVAITAFPANYLDVPAQYNSANDFTTKATYSNQIGFTAWAANSPTHSTATLLNDNNAFYVFPTRQAASTKVWATIYGKYNPDGLASSSANEVQAFWSVAFGGADGVIASPLKEGNKYIVTIELKGSASNGGGSEEDPTIETVNQYLNIKVDQAVWTVLTPKKVIQ